MSLFEFALFLHVLIAIAGFGPTFIFSILGAMGGKEPAHVNFALRVSHTIATRLVIPMAVAMPIVGTWLIFLGDWDLGSNPWLTTAIGLYAVAFFNSVLILVPTGRKLIEMTERMKPPPEGAAPGGPPPEMLRLIRRQRLIGPLNGVLLIAIILLMVWKPGATFAGT